MTDIPKIGLEISLAQRKQSNIDPNENSIQQFVGDMFGSALSTAMVIQRESENNINTMKSLSAEQKEQILYDCELNTKDSFFEAAALNVVKKANGRTSAIDRNKLASQMGTGTFVTLPGGSKFDTRVIGRPSSQHASNNKLVAQRKTKAHLLACNQIYTSNSMVFQLHAIKNKGEQVLSLHRLTIDLATMKLLICWTNLLLK